MGNGGFSQRKYFLLIIHKPVVWFSYPGDWRTLRLLLKENFWMGLYSAGTLVQETTVKPDYIKIWVLVLWWWHSSRFVPMKALGMVIFSHILSRTSRPDSGLAIALTMAVMSLWIVRWLSSSIPMKTEQTWIVGWMDEKKIKAGCWRGWWEWYRSVGGGSPSWRQCETPRQPGQWDELAHLLGDNVIMWDNISTSD